MTPSPIAPVPVTVPMTLEAEQARKPEHPLRLAKKPSSANALCWFGVELAASGMTLAGMFLGSTTQAGAIFYLASLFFWFALIYKRKLWGLVPLNVASGVIAWVNLGRALAAAG